VLQSNPSANLKVLVVWEPVLATDWGNPSPSLTAMIPDGRAIHFWDRGRRLSAMMGGPANLSALAHNEKVGFRMKDIIWDTALVFPPSAKWGTPAALLLAPVVKFRDDLAAAVRAIH
jgi:hypothetical protein